MLLLYCGPSKITRNVLGSFNAMKIQFQNLIINIYRRTAHLTLPPKLLLGIKYLEKDIMLLAGRTFSGLC
jgi:hypothetical protein